MKQYFIYRIIPIVILSLTMQSCFVAKSYKREEVVDEQYYRTDMLSQDTLSMANLSWKELFSDPILVKHIEKGLEANLDIRIAMENINAAEAYMKQGKMGYLPSLGIGGDYTHIVPSKNSAMGMMTGGERNKIDQFQATANLSWELDVWGKIRSNKRAFAAGYLQTISAHQAVKTQLITSIASTYFQLLSLDEQSKIIEETIENRTRSLATIKVLKDAGQVTEVAVKQTEAQLLNAKSLLLDIKNNIKLTENTLSILLGENPNDIERSTLAEQSLNTDLKVGLPIQLLSNRPDVRAAEYALINAFEMTNVARSNFYPSIKLSANGGFQSIEFDKLFNVYSLFANVIGSIAQPLINGRQIQTQYDVSKANQEKAYLSYKKAILNASKEVSDALYTYETLTEKKELKKQEYEAYDLATKYSEELQNNGMGNYLEVLRSRENALSAQISLINTQLGQLNAVLQLYKAVGGGVN